MLNEIKNIITKSDGVYKNNTQIKNQLNETQKKFLIDITKFLPITLEELLKGSK